MNINDIKTQIGLSHLLLVRQMDQVNPTVKTEWLSHWDNDKRVRVTMHQDVLARIQADPTKPGLGLKKELVLAHNRADGSAVADYTRYVVITPANIEATF